MSDPLRDVVASPWFDVGAPLLFAASGVADDLDNMGLLLNMLREANDCRPVGILCDEQGQWEAHWWNEAAGEWEDEVAPTPCQALCRAILAMPPATGTSADGSPDTA